MRPFHILTKPIGPICNLDCKYCFYLEKEQLYPDTKKWSMPEDLLESYIRQYIEAQDSPEIHFAWQGGEPTLLGVKFFAQVVALQQKYADGKRIHNAFQTNGVLLNDEWASLFAENGFLVGLSIDGPQELHDFYRVDKGDQPTFTRVLRGMEFLKKHKVDFNTLTTVHRKNSYYPLEVYRFLKEIGSGFMQFIPIVERKSTLVNIQGLAGPSSGDDAEVTDWSVEPEQYGKFLIAIFDEWVRKDVGKYFVQLFDVTLESWLGLEASLCIFRKTCGSAMALEHNGDLYSCDHFVYPENRLGNLMEVPLQELGSSPQQRKFGQDKQDTLPAYCRKCEVRFACNGECPKHRFLKTPDGEPGLNYLCTAYKAFFRHVDPSMQFMARELKEERAPANVMAWLAGNSSASARTSGTAVALGRNDLCSCGSGKKYKKCCGAGF